MGRPYPYMIYRNMEQFRVHAADRVVKVGDTVSDIREGKNAGVYTIGIIEGSSEIGLTQEEYQTLPLSHRAPLIQKVKARYLEAGADAVIMNMSGLIPLLEAISE